MRIDCNGLPCKFPVLPENPKLLLSLTFSSYSGTLDQHLCAPADALWKVSHVTGHLCTACLWCFAGALPAIPQPGKRGLTASTRRLQTGHLPIRRRKSPNAEFARGSLRSRGEELCIPESSCYPLVCAQL